MGTHMTSANFEILGAEEVEQDQLAPLPGARREVPDGPEDDLAMRMIQSENIVAPEDKISFARELRDTPDQSEATIATAAQIEEIGKRESAFIRGENSLFPSDERFGELGESRIAAQRAAEARTGAMIEAQKGLKGRLFGPGNWEVETSFKAADDPLGKLNEDMNISWQREGLPENARRAAAVGARHIADFNSERSEMVVDAGTAFRHALDEGNGGPGEYLVSRAVAHRMKETLWSIAPGTAERDEERSRLLNQFARDDREQLSSGRLQAIAKGIASLAPEGELGDRARLDLECMETGISLLAEKEGARWNEEASNTIPAMRASVRDMDEMDLKVEERLAVGREAAATGHHERAVKAIDREIILNPHPERYLSLSEAKVEFEAAGAVGNYSQAGLDASRQVLAEGLIRHPGQSAALADARLTAVANHMRDEKLISREMSGIEAQIDQLPAGERVSTLAAESSARNKSFVQQHGSAMDLQRETKGAWAALGRSIDADPTPHKQGQEAQTMRRAAGIKNGDGFVQAAVCERVALRYGEEARTAERHRSTEKTSKASTRRSRVEHMMV